MVKRATAGSWTPDRDWRAITWAGRCLAAAMLMLLAAPPLLATAAADSTIGFSNFSIGVANGTVVYSGAWTAEGFAEAQNSFGDLDNDFVSNSGSPATADAAVPHAEGHGNADGAGVSGGASSGASIPGALHAQASSTGRGTLANSFMITGGNGALDALFSIDISGLLHVFTDSLGRLAVTETILNLQVDGASVLAFDMQLMRGPDSDVTAPFAQTLMAMMALQYNTEYFLLIEADSESSAINIPEPQTWVLLAAGLGFLLLMAGELKWSIRLDA